MKSKMDKCFWTETDPNWYQAELDPELGIEIPVGTWERVVNALESQGLNVHCSTRLIDYSPWIDENGNGHPGRGESRIELYVVDSAGKVCGSMKQVVKNYLVYKGETNNES